MQWKIGCSGYQYAEWKGIFYPHGLSQQKWFEHYAKHFNSLELNTTFYRFPKIDFLKSWYKRSPEEFTFTVKAPRLITHYKRLKEAQDALKNFYDTVNEGLQEKLGFILFQFPSSFTFEEHRLERIISLLDHSKKNVVEFRHESWWMESVYKAFSERNISYCSISHPGLPDDVLKTSENVYYRFHGVPFLYSSKYKENELEKVAQSIQNLKGVKEAYVYFNNTAEAAAIQNAKQFQELCEEVSH